MEQRHVLSLLVENHPGVLTRISGFFSRRCFNIDSLTVSATHQPNIAKMTVSLSGNDEHLQQVGRQLAKLIDVRSIVVINPSSAIFRELLLIKLSVRAPLHATPEELRRSIERTATDYGGKIVSWATPIATIELTADSDGVDDFLDALAGHEIIDMARTGITALESNSKVLDHDARVRGGSIYPPLHEGFYGITTGSAAYLSGC